MTTKQLDELLQSHENDFKSEIKNVYDSVDTAPIANSDIDFIAKQTFYLFESFRTEIIKYLDSNK